MLRLWPRVERLHASFAVQFGDDRCFGRSRNRWSRSWRFAGSVAEARLLFGVCWCCRSNQGGAARWQVYNEGYCSTIVSECCSLIAVSFVVEHLPAMPIMPVKPDSWQAGRAMHRPVVYRAPHLRVAELIAAVHQRDCKILAGARVSRKTCCPTCAAGPGLGGAFYSKETSAQCHEDWATC